MLFYSHQAKIVNRPAEITPKPTWRVACCQLKRALTHAEGQLPGQSLKGSINVGPTRNKVLTPFTTSIIGGQTS